MLERAHFFFYECSFKLETDATQTDPRGQSRDLIQLPNVFEKKKKNPTEAIKMDKCPHLLPLERAPLSILDCLHHSLPFQSDRTFHMVMYCLLSGPQDVTFPTGFSPPGRYWRCVFDVVTEFHRGSVINVHYEAGGQKGCFIYIFFYSTVQNMITFYQTFLALQGLERLCA